MIGIKRVYEERREGDGARILVDRLWPRGLRKADAEGVLWLKDLAPSNEVRKRFGHRPEDWERFREEYTRELEAKQELLNEVIEKARAGEVTLLYSAKDTARNNAVVLKEYLDSMV
jgi:uncharacterized protein YeaO (DUF488 family)